MYPFNISTDEHVPQKYLDFVMIFTDILTISIEWFLKIIFTDICGYLEINYI